MAQDSAVGIATRYDLAFRGSNPGGGRDFPHPSRPGLEATRPPIQWVLIRSRAKRSGCGADHPPPSSAEVKEGLEL